MFKLIAIVVFSIFIITIIGVKGEKMPKTIYDFTVKNIDKQEVDLSKYQGKVVLIVNVASKCGYTPQYAGLEKLYEDYAKKGFVVLAFPCNQFRKQEPGTNEEIKEFCSTNYNVSFPLFDKIDVNGKNAHPLYKFLTSSKPGVAGSKQIKWNFTKFLIDKNGVPFKRYSPATKPNALRSDIEKLLGK